MLESVRIGYKTGLMGHYGQIKTAASRVWRVMMSPVRLPRLQSTQTPSLIKVELDMMTGARIELVS